MTSWAHTFSGLSGSTPASYLDDNFTQAAFAVDVAALSATVTALPGSTVPLKPVAAGAAGSAATLSKVDHQHPPQSATPNLQTGTSYTLLATDDGGVLDIANAGAITLTLPNTLAIGFSCLITQSGAGQVTLTPAGGALLRQRQSLTKTAGQWAVITLYVRSNVGGTAAEWVAAGDMA